MATRNINILVVGATGKQGGAVIRALRGMGRDDITVHVLALTRNVESDGAKALLAERYKGLVDLVQGDITKPEPIFASQPQGSIDAVFLVTTPGKMPEDQQAIPFIDAAVEHGVKHIVFSSVERGGDEKSWTNPTDIKHFREKHNIEIHIRDKAKKEPAKFTWTIIRPVAFMDNWNGGFFGAAFSALLSVTLKPDTKLQLVSVHDIGRFASAALIFPGKWAGRAFGLAGDALTLDEAKKAFQSVVGLELPQTWTFLAKSMLWMVKDVNAMFRWFETDGYAADIDARRSEILTQDFEIWLRDSSEYRQLMP